MTTSSEIEITENKRQALRKATTEDVLIATLRRQAPGELRELERAGVISRESVVRASTLLEQTSSVPATFTDVVWAYRSSGGVFRDEHDGEVDGVDEVDAGELLFLHLLRAVPKMVLEQTILFIGEQVSERAMNTVKVVLDDYSTYGIRPGVGAEDLKKYIDERLVPELRGAPATNQGSAGLVALLYGLLGIKDPDASSPPDGFFDDLIKASKAVEKWPTFREFFQAIGKKHEVVPIWVGDSTKVVCGPNADVEHPGAPALREELFLRDLYNEEEVRQRLHQRMCDCSACKLAVTIMRAEGPVYTKRVGN